MWQTQKWWMICLWTLMCRKAKKMKGAAGGIPLAPPEPPRDMDIARKIYPSQRDYVLPVYPSPRDYVMPMYSSRVTQLARASPPEPQPEILGRPPPFTPPLPFPAPHAAAAEPLRHSASFPALPPPLSPSPAAAAMPLPQPAPLSLPLPSIPLQTVARVPPPQPVPFPPPAPPSFLPPPAAGVVPLQMDGAAGAVVPSASPIPVSTSRVGPRVFTTSSPCREWSWGCRAFCLSSIGATAQSACHGPPSCFSASSWPTILRFLQAILRAVAPGCGQ